MTRALLGFAVGWLACAPCLLAHVHEIFVGRSAAGKLKIRIGGTPPARLNVSVFPGYPGWAEGQPGFECPALDDPANDFYIPAAAANIEWVLLAIGPGLNVLNDTGSAPMNIGEAYHLGNPFFDVHPFWYLYPGRPGLLTFVRLKVRDTTGLYQESDELELPFTPEGCYPNCDDSTTDPVLNVQDFGCFLNLFASGDTKANCDLSTTPPILNVQDFSCFLNTFAGGCQE